MGEQVLLRLIKTLKPVCCHWHPHTDGWECCWCGTRRAGARPAPRRDGTCRLQESFVDGDQALPPARTVTPTVAPPGRRRKPARRRAA